MDHLSQLRAERDCLERLMKNEDFLSTFWKWFQEGREDAVYQMAGGKDEKVYVGQGMFKAFDFLMTRPDWIKTELEVEEKRIESQNDKKVDY